MALIYYSLVAMTFTVQQRGLKQGCVVGLHEM